MKRDEAEAVTPAALPDKYFWHPREIKILREHYAEKGPHGCMPLLPDRTANAIYMTASRLGLRTTCRIKWRPRDPEAFDQAVRALYATAPARGEISKAAAAHGVPAWFLRRRAVELGLTAPRIKEPDWTAAEDALLEKHAHHRPRSITRAFRAAGLRRTESSIVTRRKHLRLSTDDPDAWSAYALGQLLGVDGHTITTWIRRYGLPARRRGTDRTPQQGGDEFVIERKPLRAWIRDNAVRIDLRKVDRFWFIDLCLGGDQ